MAAWTDFAENKLIDWFFRAQALGIAGATAAAGTGPATLYVGLVVTDSTDATAGTEATGGSYARVPVTSSLANWAGTQGAGTTAVSSGTGGTTSNNNQIAFAAPSGAWGLVVGVGIWEAATGGNMLIRSPMVVSKQVNSGDAPPIFEAGSLTFKLDD